MILELIKWVLYLVWFLWEEQLKEALVDSFDVSVFIEQEIFHIGGQLQKRWVHPELIWKLVDHWDLQLDWENKTLPIKSEHSPREIKYWILPMYNEFVDKFVMDRSNMFWEKIINISYLS